MYYKVCIGARRYTTEKIFYISAESAEAACARAIRLNDGMRYAVAQNVIWTSDIVGKILSIDGYVISGSNKIAFYGHDGFVVNLENGCSLFFKDKTKAIDAFIRGANSSAR